MLDEKRITEAEHNFPRYLEDNLLKKIKSDKNIINILTKNAEESLQEARNVQSHLWKIVMSYYSMFYIANAVLVSKGYKVGNKTAHKVTADALIVLLRNDVDIEAFESSKEEALSGISADDAIDSFEMERAKRGRLQYSTTELAKKNKADTSLKRAQEFMFHMRSLL